MKNNTFASRLRFARVMNNLTHRDLSSLSGVSASSIQSYEYGRRYPTSNSLVKLADALGLSTDYLIGRADK